VISGIGDHGSSDAVAAAPENEEARLGAALTMIVVEAEAEAEVEDGR
jgi:hypothetical protein